MRRCFALGHDLVVVGRNRQKAAASVGVPHTFYAWPAADAAFPDAALAGVDAVVALAGESITAGRWTRAMKERIRASRVDGTTKLVAAIAARQARGDAVPAALISASAVGYYGAARGDEELTEASAPGSDYLAEVCRAWEAAAEAAEACGVRVALLRIGVVLGREGGILERLRPVFANGVGGALGNGQQWMSWVHADDLVEMLVAAATDAGWRGAYNATAPEPVRNTDFTKALAAAMGSRVGPSVPAPALRVAFGEMSDALLGSQRVLPRRTLAQGFAFLHPTLAGALSAEVAADNAADDVYEAVQWLPRPLDEVYAFFSSEHNLEQLTPSTLSFKVLRSSTPQIRAGTLIDYRLSVHGIPMRWRTRIAAWSPPQSFVDEQLRGPYAKWVHTHTFKPLTYNGVEGTLIADRVLYRLPLGAVGRLAGGAFVRHDLAAIFAFRRQAIDAWAREGHS